MPFNTEEEIFGGAQGEQPGSQAAYWKELAQRRFLMEMQRQYNESSLALQNEANAIANRQAEDQRKFNADSLALQKEFNAKSLVIQREQAETAKDQGKSARWSLVIGAGSMVVAAAAILVSILLG